MYRDKGGNSGTVPGTGVGQNNLGTKDNNDVIIATNSNEALRVTSDGQIQATQPGIAENPTYSFSNDRDTGIYSSDSDKLNISAAGISLMEFDGNSNSKITLNNNNRDVDTRIASQGQPNMLFVNASTNRIEISQNNPQATLCLGRTASTIAHRRS